MNTKTSVNSKYIMRYLKQLKYKYRRYTTMGEFKKFKIEKETHTTKTIRIPESLFEEASKIAQMNEISFNEFVNRSLRYAIDNYEE